jgi:hypothetical protein
MSALLASPDRDPFACIRGSDYRIGKNGERQNRLKNHAECHNSAASKQASQERPPEIHNDMSTPIRPARLARLPWQPN